MSTHLLDTLRARFAGDTLRGLRGEAAEQKARTFTLERLLDLRAVALALAKEIQDALETARTQEARGIALTLQERADKGENLNLVWDAAKAPLQLKVCEHYIESCRDEYGLKDQPHRQANVSLADVIRSINDRIALLERELLERYRRDGLPAEAVELQRRIIEAAKAEWPLRKAQKEVHEANNGRGGLFEAEAHAANAALWKAEAVTNALRKELRDRFALRA